MTVRVGDEYQAQIPPFSADVQEFQNPLEFYLQVPITCNINKETNMLPVPYSPFQESWSTIEHDSFVLALYIFGKKLRVINKFMGNKGMQNVMSYYYGKFYRTKVHEKWSTYRKTRARKSVLGRKIFNGWRLQELLSRLLPNVTDECKASLNQVTETYEDGKLSFENYVFSVRDTAGVDLLVKAVAIGKGKQDLTRKLRNPSKSKKPKHDAAADSCTKMDLGADGRPVRHLKFVYKRKTKRQRVDNKDEAMKPTRIPKDLNNPRVESVLSEATANPTELLSPHGQRQSSGRTRVLTTKALEALANGSMNVKKKRTGLEDGSSRCVRAKSGSCYELWSALLR